MFYASATDIYVSINGSDTSLGTKEKPLATLHAAIRKVRELRRLNDASIKGGIRIIMGKGFYQLHEPIVLRPEGVQPTSTGYENYTIDPNLGGLAWMEGKVLTANGDISVFCSKKEIKVSSPTGTGKLKIKSKTKPVVKVKEVSKGLYEVTIEKGKDYSVKYSD
ncbi:hypothetical protein IM793_06440 [Pedobacter sp. MR2016-19]|uniref:hypothetical protein n=1 Tax=Pedobacter sp. MR2016-19 TaxID=2780089 RepID=UPI001875903B|nr:hypothetical protein [Pedobacter sp. MR2016-19]MBE5318783.1 hypothetical protein [Pedobacter sp. MR2016-19]